jgi:serine-type D-Ala-D-Ala carboxypeptidase (penicillin-binding protein 5/6)
LNDPGKSAPAWAACRRLGVLVLAACMAACVVAPSAFAAKIPSPPVSVPSATLMTMDGSPLWSRKPTAHRRVASTIKMLNALVVRDRAKLDDVVVVTRKSQAITDGDVGLVAGQRLTVRQLLKIMLIPSANDAAMALAIHIGGSEAKYVKLMNAKAKKLGLKNTHAADPDGLNKRETSTASDLTVLARHVMADPVLRSIVRQRRVSVPRRNGGHSTVRSTDLLLGHYTGMEGTKTGFTNPAGYCFVGSAKRGGVELLGVVLGAKSNAGRFSEMRKLLDWGFAHCHVRTVLKKGAPLGSVTVTGGAETSVSVCTTCTVSMALFDGGKPVTMRSTLPTSVAAPVAVGQRLGTVRVYKGSQLLTSAPLVAASAVPSQSVPSTSGAPGGTP